MIDVDVDFGVTLLFGVVPEIGPWLFTEDESARSFPLTYVNFSWN